MKMKKVIAVSVLTAGMVSSVFAAEKNMDETFSRVVEIDNELNKLIAERDNLISQKTDNASGYGDYETTYHEGQYKIGSEIPAGEYVFFATGDFQGSFKETTDSNGSDRVESEYFYYNYIYTITEGNYITISNAFAVPADQVTELNTKKGYGMFRVGKDIAAGEYQLVPTKFTVPGSFHTYSSSETGLRENRLDNDYFSSITYVNVHDGEYLLIENSLFVE